MRLRVLAGLLGISLISTGCVGATSNPTAVVQAETVLTETPAADSEAEYNLRGSPLTLAVELPGAPSSASVLELVPDGPVSLEAAQALAAQFGMDGPAYAMDGDPSQPARLLFADGNRQLQVNSASNFVYYPIPFGDWAATSEAPEDAEEKVLAFLGDFGFAGDYQIGYSETHAFVAIPLGEGGLPLRYDTLRPAGFQFGFHNGEIAYVHGSLLHYESLGSFPLISAEEAFEKMLAPYPAYGRHNEVFLSSPWQGQAWMRQYPYDKPVTIYGWLSAYPAVDTSGRSINLNGYAVEGNLENIPDYLPQIFVMATGQFHNEAGIDTFQLDSWTNAESEGQQGTLESKNGQVVLRTTERGDLLMPDVPADVPLQLEGVYAMGVTVGDTFEWGAFDQRLANGGGGGGGGSFGSPGLYAIDLDGIPEALPTPTRPSWLPAVETRLAAERGLVTVTIYRRLDGSLDRQVLFFYNGPDEVQVFLNLKGELEPLEALHNRPVDIWGTVTGYDEFDVPIVTVDRFEAPYPDLEFQILEGAERLETIDGETLAVLDADNGQTYVQMTPYDYPIGWLTNAEGDHRVQAEVLLIPDETYGGYPVARVFGAGVDEPNAQMPITADKPDFVDESQIPPYQPPSLTIDTVELVYLIDQGYAMQENTGGPYWAQPMWRFAGHSSSGDVFEILIQALDPDYLSPVIQTVEPPG